LNQKSVLKSRITLTLLSQKANRLVKYLRNLTPYFEHDASKISFEVGKVDLKHPLIYQKKRSAEETVDSVKASTTEELEEYWEK
jgi:hypothetical protein